MKQIKKQLLYCRPCLQMTNHIGLQCQKCGLEMKEIITLTSNKYRDKLLEERLKERKEIIDLIEQELLMGNLRDEFDNCFPKDKEAEEGIRPSKSNRSGALLYQGLIISYLRGLK